MPKRDPRGPLLDMRAYAHAAIRIASEMMLDELRDEILLNVVRHSLPELVAELDTALARNDRISDGD